MNISNKVFKDLDDLSQHVRHGDSTFYHAAQTSTVIPFDKLEIHLSKEEVEKFTLGNLSVLATSLELDERGNLIVEGPVSWKEAREFCQSKGREVLTSPTEELACVLSGVATSCTGERCFGMGTLRDHLVEVEYLDFKGQIKKLKGEEPLIDTELFAEQKAKVLLSSYQAEYSEYQKFKNAPFPRMQFETDLMTGTEGQLGVITKAVIKTAPLRKVNYIFIALKKWEEDFSMHQLVFETVQSLREGIFSCELIDENSWQY